MAEPQVATDDALHQAVWQMVDEGLRTKKAIPVEDLSAAIVKINPKAAGADPWSVVRGWAKANPGHNLEDLNIESDAPEASSGMESLGELPGPMVINPKSIVQPAYSVFWE